MPKTIFEAAATNDVTTIQKLLKNKVPINKKFTPINGRTYIMMPLANITYYGKKLLTWGSASFLAFCGLLAAPKSGGLALFLSGGFLTLAKYADDKGDKLLLEYTFNCSGWTTLHFAAANDAKSAAVCLIVNGADVTLTDHSKEERNYLAIAKKLNHTEFRTICTLVVNFMSQYNRNLKRLTEQVNNNLQRMLEINQRRDVLLRDLSIARSNQNQEAAEANQSLLNNFLSFFSGIQARGLADRIANISTELQRLDGSDRDLTAQLRQSLIETATLKNELNRTIAQNLQLSSQYIKLDEVKKTLENHIQRLEASIRSGLNSSTVAQSRQTGTMTPASRCTIM